MKQNDINIKVSVKHRELLDCNTLDKLATVLIPNDKRDRYQLRHGFERTDDVHLDIDLSERIYCPKGFEDAIDDLNAKYKVNYEDLVIYDKKFIRFEDDEVYKVLKEHGVGLDTDGIAANELKEVTDIGTWFLGNTEITSFEELSKTGVTTLSSGLNNQNYGSFLDCTNLKNIDVSKIKTINNYSTFKNCSSLQELLRFDSLESVKLYNLFTGCSSKIFYCPKLKLTQGFTRSSLTDSTGQNGEVYFFPSAILFGGNYQNVGRSTQRTLLDLGKELLTFNHSMWNQGSPGFKYIIIRSNSEPIFLRYSDNDYFRNNTYIFTPWLYLSQPETINVKNRLIGGNDWLTIMQSLAEERGKSFEDYSLRYIDYDIYGIDDYSTNTLNGFKFSLPEEYLGTDGSTYVFDKAPLIIDYDPDNTRKEYFELVTTDESKKLGVKDTEVRYVKDLTLVKETNGAIHDVTFLANSTLVGGVLSTLTLLFAYPWIKSIEVIYNNSTLFASTNIIESNTNNPKYTGLIFSTTGDIGVSNNGFVYTKENNVNASGTVTVSSAWNTETKNVMNVNLPSTSIQRLYFEDPEVERILAVNMTNIDTGDVITLLLLAAVTDIKQWFRENTEITSFDELGKTGVTNLSNSFKDCTNLLSVDITKITLFDTGCFSGCQNLDVRIPESTTKIGANAFSNNKSNTTKKLYLPNVYGNDLSGSDNCISYWNELEYVDIPNVTEDNVSNFVCFSYCPNISTFRAKSLRVIGFTGSLNENRSIFYNNTKLKRLILPSLVALGGLTSGTNRLALDIIDLGRNLNEIRCSFSDRFGFTSTTSIVIRADVPPTVSNNAIVKNYTFFVPSNAVSAYQSAENWEGAIIYPIGGAEWISRFGSSDEYADLTQEEKEYNYPEA